MGHRTNEIIEKKTIHAICCYYHSDWLWGWKILQNLKEENDLTKGNDRKKENDAKLCEREMYFTHTFFDILF